MLYIFLVCGVVIATWLVVVSLARTGAARDETRVRREMRAAVRRSLGLDIDGDPLVAYSMRGEMHGVETSIEGRMTPPLPGAFPHVVVTAITVRTSLPDQIVCRKADVEKVMGSLPSVPRRTTGDPRFDEQFAVFVGASTQEQPAGYRDPPAGVSSIPWADPTTLEAMITHGLLFLRVRDGACLLAFPPKRPHEVEPLVAVAANVARRPAGEPLVIVPKASTFVAPARSFYSAESASRWTLWLLCGMPLAVVIAFFPPLRALNATMECGAGGEIRVSSNDLGDEGTSYGLYCWNNGPVWGPPLLGHYASAVAIGLTLILGIATWIILARFPIKLDAHRGRR